MDHLYIRWWHTPLLTSRSFTTRPPPPDRSALALMWQIRFTECWVAIPRASGLKPAEGGWVDGGGGALGKSIQLSLQHPSCERLQIRSVFEGLLLFFDNRLNLEKKQISVILIPFGSCDVLFSGCSLSLAGWDKNVPAGLIVEMWRHFMSL